MDATSVLEDGFAPQTQSPTSCNKVKKPDQRIVEEASNDVTFQPKTTFKDTSDQQPSANNQTGNSGDNESSLLGQSKVEKRGRTKTRGKRAGTKVRKGKDIESFLAVVLELLEREVGSNERK